MGARDARSKFFQFHAVLGEKIGQIIAFAIHLSSWRAPQGNPGSIRHCTKTIFTLEFHRKCNKKYSQNKLMFP